MGTEIAYFHTEFKRVPRTEREQILCAMIRINYGTPWDGDRELLEAFFPKHFHRTLVFGGLTELIEALNPFADEPTDYGIKTEERTDLIGEVTEKHSFETTEWIDGITTDIPLGMVEDTAPIKIS